MTAIAPSTPRLVIDGRALRAGASGVGHFVAGILSGLNQLIDAGAPWRVTVLRLPQAHQDAWSRAAFDALRNVDVAPVAVDYESHPRAEWWLHHGLHDVVRRHGGAALFSPAFVGPWGRARFARVLLAHDAIAWTHPGNYPARFRAYLSMATRLSARAADIVATVSPPEARLLTRLRIGGRTDWRVIPDGVDTRVFRPDATIAREGAVLCVSSAEPRKNHPILFQALRRFDPPPPVWIVGVRDSAARRRLTIEGRDLDLHFLEPDSDADLVDIYRRAAAVALPSRREGFGLPLLEAMACGTPVVASDIPSARWLSRAGACAQLAGTDDVPAWEKALRVALSGGEAVAQRASLAERRAARFTWVDSARRLLDLAAEAVKRKNA